MKQYDMYDVLDYDGCLEIHQAYLDKQAALDELYWEWVADFPEDLYSVEYVNNLIRRLNNERL